MTATGKSAAGLVGLDISLLYQNRYIVLMHIYAGFCYVYKITYKKEML